MRAAVVAFLLVAAVGCAGTSPARGPAPPSAQARKAPGKCSACHLAPTEHSLAANRWPSYLKAHKRRLHLSDEEQRFLYDFLVGGGPPPAQTP